MAVRTLPNPLTTTSLLPLTASGTNVFPAGYFTAGRSPVLTLGGVYSATASATLTFTVQLGGATLTSGSFTTAALSTSTNLGFIISLPITCLTVTGSTCTATLNGGLDYTLAGTALANRGHVDLKLSGATFTINTAQANTLDVLVSFGSSNAANTITTLKAVIAEQ